MFRDESSHVIKKAKAKARRKAGIAEDTLSPPSQPVSRAASVPAPQTPEVKPKVPNLLTPNSFQEDDRQKELWRRPDEGSLLPSPDAPNWPSTPRIALAYSLAPTFQECGTAYFFSQYVSVRETACHQRFDFVYDVWRPISNSNQPEDRAQVDGVMAAMTAVGLASLSAMTRSEPMMESARKSYGTALRLTNAALRDPAEAVKDSTLLSVLILGLYEMIAGRRRNAPASAGSSSSSNIRAWQEHVNGAAALARMRGISQFRTRAGIKMFLMLCQSVMVSCIQRQVPMPPALIDLRRRLGDMLDRPDPAWRVCEPIYKILEIRSELKRGNTAGNDRGREGREQLVQRLLDIEREFQDITADFPPSYGFRTLRVERPHPAVWGNICHVYPSMFHATVWNGVRSARMMIHETILEELRDAWAENEELDVEEAENAEDFFDGVDSQDGFPYATFDHSDDQPQARQRQRYRPFTDPRWVLEYRRSYLMLERLSDAILASVPQHLGLVSNRRLGGSIPTVEIREPPKSSPGSTSSSRSSMAGSPPASVNVNLNAYLTPSGTVTGGSSGGSHTAMSRTASASSLQSHYSQISHQSHHSSLQQQQNNYYAASSPSPFLAPQFTSQDELSTTMQLPTINAPTSPTDSTASSHSDSSASSSSSRQRRDGGRHRRSRRRIIGGPSILDPTRARTPEEDAERFMLLASSSNMIVFPLYLVGMSSIVRGAAASGDAAKKETSDAIRTYVIDRLRAIWEECSLPQAESVASIIEEEWAAERRAAAQDEDGDEDADGEYDDGWRDMLDVEALERREEYGWLGSDAARIGRTGAYPSLEPEGYGQERWMVGGTDYSLMVV